MYSPISLGVVKSWETCRILEDRFPHWLMQKALADDGGDPSFPSPPRLSLKEEK